MITRFFPLVALSGIAMMCLPAVARATAPPNDDFENSTVLNPAASVQIHGTTFDASTQAGESDVQDTVWYSWTAPSSGKVAVSAVSEGNPLHATIAVGDDLLTAKGIAGGVMTFSPVEFYAVAGRTYKIQVSDYVPGYVSYDGYGFTLGLAIVGNIPARTAYVEPGANDNFDSPYAIRKNKLSFVQYMAQSGLEPFEASLLKRAGFTSVPNDAGTTWVTYTPTISGLAQFTATTAKGDNVVLIMGKGSSIATFKPKKVANNGITFNCKAGKKYTLCVVAEQGDQVLASIKVTAD